MSADATPTPTRRAPPLWFWGVAALGLAWNIFGAVQFVGTLSATVDSLQAQGLTAEQAAVMEQQGDEQTAEAAIAIDKHLRQPTLPSDEYVYYGN